MDPFIGKELSKLRYHAETLKGMVYEDCTFEDCVFDATTFDHCRIHNCIFHNCSFVMPQSRYTDMRFCTFWNCSLISVDFASFVSDEYIRDPVSSLEDCNLKYCSFHGMDFKEMDLSGNRFTRCSFEDCDMEGASFKGCDLNGTSFAFCDLRKADLRNASGYAVDIFNNKLKEAKFSSPEALSLLSGLDIEID